MVEVQVVVDFLKQLFQELFQRLFLDMTDMWAINLECVKLMFPAHMNCPH